MPVLGFGRKLIWHLLGTIKGKERIAEKVLTDKGLEVYLPLDEKGPLFDNYLFVRIEDEDHEVIHKSPYMWFPEIHEIHNPALVEQLRATDWQRSEDCKTGSLVRVTSGPFNYREAIVKTKKADRIIVLMNIIQGQKPQELEFKLNEVEAA